MILYHVTSRSNLSSILSVGLDPYRSRGVRKSVWGVSRSAVTWAIVHVLSKPAAKGLELSDFVVIRFSVPRQQVSRYRRKIWYTHTDYGCVPVTQDDLIPLAYFGGVRT